MGLGWRLTFQVTRRRLQFEPLECRIIGWRKWGWVGGSETRRKPSAKHGQSGLLCPDRDVLVAAPAHQSSHRSKPSQAQAAIVTNTNLSRSEKLRNTAYSLGHHPHPPDTTLQVMVVRTVTATPPAIVIVTNRTPLWTESSQTNSTESYPHLFTILAHSHNKFIRWQVTWKIPHANAIWWSILV